jgi:hypothetical protein
MYHQSEIERLKPEFDIQQKARQKSLKKIWGILLLFSLVVCATMIVIFPNQFDNGETAWILPTYGGMFVISFLGGFLVSFNLKSEKPFFTFLYKEMYKKINLDEGLFLEYDSYSKINKDFNIDGGLFTRNAKPTVKRHLKGVSKEENQFNIYDCTLTTSNGNSQTTHFNGVYISIDKQLNTSIQVRTNGSPKRKGIKYDKVEEITDFKVYKEQTEHMTNLDYSLVQFMTRLKQDFMYKKIYLSVNNNKISLALWYKKHPARKMSAVNMTQMNEVYRYFLSELELIDTLDSIGQF